MRVNWRERLEAGDGGVSWPKTLTSYSRLPAEGRRGRQGKHAAHHNAERPLPRAVARRGAQSSQGVAWVAWREGPWRWGGGCGQREEQTPMKRQEVVDGRDGKRPISHLLSLYLVLNTWKWCGETWTFRPNKHAKTRSTDVGAAPSLVLSCKVE